MSRERLRPTLYFVGALLLVLLAACGAPERSAPQLTSQLWAVPEEGEAVPLAGATLSGEVTVRLEPDAASEDGDATFYLEDVSAQNELGSSEAAPFELTFDTLLVEDGEHRLLAKLRSSEGDEAVLEASFTVANLETQGWRGGYHAPDVDAGPDLSATVDVPVELSGSVGASRYDQRRLNARWSVRSGPGMVTFADASSPSTEATFDTAGEYTLRLRASNGWRSAWDEMTVTVAEAAPEDPTPAPTPEDPAPEPEDPAPAPEDPSPTPEDPAPEDPSPEPEDPVPSNEPPTVDAGQDRTITLGEGVTLRASAQDDGLPNDRLSYRWRQTKGPSSASLSGANSRTLTVSFSEAGSYGFEVEVSDGELQARDGVAVTVQEPAGGGGDDGGDGGGDGGSGNIWQPKPGTSWQWQLTGSIDTSVDAQVYDVDLFDTPQRVIDELHGKGRKVICYFSAGSYEDWRPDAKSFPASVKGSKMDGWDELWLDISNLEALGPIMRARLDLAAQKGCDAVEPDNVDGYSNRTGFSLKASDQITYNRFLADEAHKRGLAIALKNDLEQVKALEPYFDFAINEECYTYGECDMLTPFVNAGKAVFGAEYDPSTSAFCPVTNRLNFDFIKKRLDLDAYRVTCR